MIRVSADPEGENLRLRRLSAELLDKAAGRLKRAGLELTIDRPSPLTEISERLLAEGGGKTRLVLRLDNMGKQVVLTIPRGLEPSPRQTSELKVLPGVRELREL